VTDNVIMTSILKASRLLWILFFVGCIGLQVLGAEGVLQNPIAGDGQDPWVIQKDGYYYSCYSRDGVWVNRGKTLAEAVQRGGKLVWKPERGQAYSRSLWAPELHFIEGKWTIYVAADDGDNHHHRMYVLESKTADALGEYDFKGKISEASNKWAIDGTVLEQAGQMCFIWSGWAGDVNGQQNLYIARMSDAKTIAGERVLLSEPTLDWERHGRPLINEGPQVLKGPSGRVFLVYSASGSWTDQYCLGMLELTGDDPMVAGGWVKSKQAVFEGTEDVISPGHASFTKSADGREDWIVYHTAKYKGAKWNREIHMKRFSWDAAGWPNFGVPLGKGVEFTAPSESP
jgi:GH43 family beta-xylosidase